jgi:hypothetical protein
LLDAALDLAARDLAVFPVKHDKTPRVSQYDATTDPDQIRAWWQQWPDDNIGHRVAPHHVILDIDPRHNGHATWAKLRDAVGDAWPITRGHASGRDDGGGHVWFLRPDDKLSIRALDEWARNNDVGHAVTLDDGSDTGRWTCGIDILHHTHRYSIVPPSIHAATGKPYVWLGDGLDVTPAPMPIMLADLITATPAPTITHTPRPADPASIADWYSANTRWSDLLPRHGWRLVAGDGDSDGSRWRHPSATSAFSATVRHGCLFVYSPNTPFDVTAPGDARGITPFRAYTVLDHHGDASAAARSARVMKDGEQDRPSMAVTGLIDGSTPPAAADPQAAVEVEAAPAHLPAVIWDSRTSLGHIQQAARARLVAPDAVLGAVLVRVAACAPHTLELPATVGSPVGLTFYTALVGPPESGKSAAAAVAAELLPAPEGVRDRLPIGSGEGMVEIMFDWVTEEDDDGKKVKVKRPVRQAAIFHIDEGQALADLGSRSGSTLMPTLRTAWTHGTLGNANASAERQRILDGRLYVYGITLGIQPELAGPLLADTAGGTPQRFLWLMATDPHAADTLDPWPGELDWRPPAAGELEDHAVSRGGYLRHPLTLDDAITAEVVADRRAALRGSDGRTDGDAHRMLLRLKTSALLALLDGRLGVNGEDWQLAGRIVDTSAAVRAGVTATVKTLAVVENDKAGKRLAYREEAGERVRVERAFAGWLTAIERVGRRHADGSAHTERGCVPRCFSRAVNSRYRSLVTVDEALDRAVAGRVLKNENGRWLLTAAAA